MHSTTVDYGLELLVLEGAEEKPQQPTIVKYQSFIIVIWRGNNHGYASKDKAIEILLLLLSNLDKTQLYFDLNGRL